MNTRTIGMMLIAIGVVFALGALGVIQATVAVLWPLFLLLPGVVILIVFYSNPEKGNPGLLIPGSIFTVYGALFLGTELFGDQWYGVLWPLFLIGPALGLLQFYLFSGRNPFLLIPVGVLMFIGAIFLFGNIASHAIGLVIGAVFILGGVFLLTSNKDKRDDFI